MLNVQRIFEALNRENIIVGAMCFGVFTLDLLAFHRMIGG